MKQLVGPSVNATPSKGRGNWGPIVRCSECGGPRRGPRAHQPSCSHFHKPAGPQLSGDRLMARLITMDALSLAALRSEIDKLIQSKRGEIDAKIASLQALLRR